MFVTPFAAAFSAIVFPTNVESNGTCAAVVSNAGNVDVVGKCAKTNKKGSN